MQLSVASSSLSVTSTKLLLYRIFEMPGKEKQRDFCAARSFPPWGFGFLFVGLTRSYPAAVHQQPGALAHGGGWLSPCGSSSLACTTTCVHSQKNKRGFFLHFMMEMKNRHKSQASYLHSLLWKSNVVGESCSLGAQWG